MIPGVENIHSQGGNITLKGPRIGSSGENSPYSFYVENTDVHTAHTQIYGRSVALKFYGGCDEGANASKSYCRRMMRKKAENNLM